MIWSLALVLQIIQNFLKIIALVYINHLAKFGYLISCILKDMFKNVPRSCTNIRRDVTDLIKQGMVKNTKLEYLESGI